MLRKNPDGIVSLDKSLFIGCKNCVRACPFNAIFIDPRNQLAGKCSLCEHRVRSGLLPAYVAACPTGGQGVSRFPCRGMEVSDGTMAYRIPLLTGIATE
ncbi:MAG: 4Fe-4S dicluster domain-containing protein [Nitrososphaerota archaeon]